MAIYICWKEETADFVKQEYIGGGQHMNIYRQRTVTKRARWSTEETPEMFAAARKYIETDMQDRPNAYVGTLPD